MPLGRREREFLLLLERHRALDLTIDPDERPRAAGGKARIEQPRGAEQNERGDGDGGDAVGAAHGQAPFRSDTMT